MRIILLYHLALLWPVALLADTTNTFIVTTQSPVSVPVTTSSTTSSLHVQYVHVDAVKRVITVKFVETATPIQIKGSDYTTFQTGFSASFATAIASYLSTHPMGSGGTGGN